jgi:hypothetical protein|tara:strand:+ start:1132 stop:1272 length:141 start_codon:yes stop_codon:yes gene_type:complete
MDTIVHVLGICGEPHINFNQFLLLILAFILIIKVIQYRKAGRLDKG